MREIELRLKLSPEDKTLIKTWLEKNAKFIKHIEHKEFYLDNPKSTFFFTAKDGYKDAKDYMRVRMTEKGDSVCIKRFEIDMETGKSKNIDEIEYNVSSGDEALKLFDAIGFTDKSDVSKSRDAYEYENFEIVLDKVNSLGDFAEIEIKGFPEEKDIHEGYEEIRKVIKKIGFTKYMQCNRGYVSMLWNPDHDFTIEKTLN